MAPLGAARALITAGGGPSGGLTLLETESASGKVAVDFDSISGSTYDVHFLTYTNLKTGTNSDYTQMRLSNDGGSSFEAGTAYERAIFTISADGGTDGQFRDTNYTGTDIFRFYFANAR
jgi:hypothetical protein